MGMYTHLHLDVEIKPESLQEVAKKIEFGQRLRSSSYYFYDQGKNEIESDYAVSNIPMHVLHTDISLKNYEGEIDRFLEFLNDKVTDMSEGQFYGFVRYEEDNIPDLIVWKDSKFDRIKPNEYYDLSKLTI